MFFIELSETIEKKREPATEMPKPCVDEIERQIRFDEEVDKVKCNIKKFTESNPNWSDWSAPTLLKSLLGVGVVPGRKLTKKEVDAFITKWIDPRFAPTLSPLGSSATC